MHFLSCRLIGLTFSLLLIFTNVSKSAESTLEQEITQAAASGQTTFTLPAGTHKISQRILLKNLRNFTIEATGAMLQSSAWKDFGIRFENCSNVTLRGLTLDYNPLPFTQGTITQIGEKGSLIEVSLHDGYPDLNEEFLRGHAHAFEPTEHRWKADSPDLYAKKNTLLSPRKVRMEFPKSSKPERLKIGDRIAIDHRGIGGIKFTQCENVRVENVTIHAAPGIAVICRYMKGDNYFSYDVKPGPLPAGATEPRLLSSSADGFNFANARKGPILEKSNFSFMGDDAVNLHGPTFMVAEQVSEREVIIGWRWNQESLAWLIQPGDTARRLQQGNFAILGEAKIESFQQERNPEPLWVETVRKNFPKATEVKGIFRLKLDRPLHCQPGDALDIPTINAPGYRLADNYFHDHRARGMRLMASDGIVENNTFERIKASAITLGPEYGFWREAGWLENVVVQKNRMNFCTLVPGLDPSVAGVISIMGHVDEPIPLKTGEQANQNIVLRENLIENTSAKPVTIDYAAQVTVE